MATLRQAFTDIADSVRAQGVEGKMTPLEMPGKIQSMPVDENLYEPFYIEALSGDAVIKMLNVSPPFRSYFVSSFDKETWTDVGEFTSAVTIPQGQKLYLKARNENTSIGGNTPSNIKYKYFQNAASSSRVQVGGNIMSLLWNKDFYSPSKVLSTGRTFQALFYSMTTLVSCSKLRLPSKVVPRCGYNNMFWGCSNLVNAFPSFPQWDNNALYDASLGYMFWGCNLSRLPRFTGRVVPIYSQTNSSTFFRFATGNANLNQVWYPGKLDYYNFGEWLTNCASSGTIWCTGVVGNLNPSAVPSGWTLNTVPLEQVE